MAKGRKTGGRDWKPGETGNPNGGPGLPKDLREARKVNQMELERAINKMTSLTEPELEALIASPGTLVFDKFVANIVKLGMRDGDERRMEFILQRMIGKVPDQVRVEAVPTLTVFGVEGEKLVEAGMEKK